MSPRVKKVAALAIKIAILGAILEYARRQSQLADEIAVSEQVVLSAGGRSTEIAAGSRLIVVDTDGANDQVHAYRVKTADGSELEIAASEVEGSATRTAAGHASFMLRPGMRTLFRQLDFGLLALAFAMFGPALFLMAVRWRMLLVASGVHVPFSTLVRLHYMAFFFNTFMPGGAGGDIVKAVYVTRHSSQKAEAATMVLIDRVIGLIGLLLMAGAVVIVDYREMQGIALEVSAISFFLAIAAVLFFSTRFRKLIRYEILLAKLPRADVVERVDAALLGLGQKKGSLAAALGLTVLLQLLEVVGVFLAGQAIGLHHARFAHYLAFVPIGYLFNALPISFGGIGLMEGAYLKLFRDAGVATATQGFTLGVLARLIVVGWSLVGAVSALFPPERAKVTSPC